MEITYRIAKEQDSHKFKLLNDKFNGPNTNSIDNIKKYLSNIDTEVVFVAEYMDHLIGFCCCQLIKSVCYDGCHLEITELYVEEDYQKKGIGRGLIDSIEIYCKNNNIMKIELLTGKMNSNAQEFYEHLGYLKTKQIHYKKKISVE